MHGDNAAIDREPKGSAAMGTALDRIGHLLARYLEKPVQGYEPFTPSDPAALCARLRPGDVLLVENDNRVGRHQISHPIDLVACRALVGRIGDRETADGEPLTGGSQSWRRRRRGSCVKVFPLPHPHLPADRLVKGRLRPRLCICQRAHRL